MSGVILQNVLWLFDQLVDLFLFCLIANIVISWLITFNILNPYQPFVRQLTTFLYRLTEPLLRPIRNLLPDLGGLDISPVLLVLLIVFSRNIIFELVARYAS